MNCSTPLKNTLHDSSLLNISDNDTYESTRSSSSRRAKQKPSIDFKKIEAEIRRVLVLSQYRSIDLAVRLEVSRLILINLICLSLVCIWS